MPISVPRGQRLTFSSDLQVQYSTYKNTLQQLAQKIGDVEQEAEEHKYEARIFFTFLFAKPDRVGLFWVFWPGVSPRVTWPWLFHITPLDAASFPASHRSSLTAPAGLFLRPWIPFPATASASA